MVTESVISKARGIRKQRDDTLTAYLFLAPTLIIFITLVIFPVLVSFVISFADWNFMKGFKAIKFTGIENYQSMIKDDRFVQAIKNTFIYTAATVPTSLIIALTIAYTLNKKCFLKKFLQLCFFIPYISSTVATAAVFKVLFRTDGVINQILVNVFRVAEPPDWFSVSSISRVPIIVFVIWSAIGYELVIYLAALQNIPATLYEAAEIDGAPEFTKFMRITLPMISPTTFYLLIIRLIAVFKIFTSVNIMTLGTPGRVNTSVVMRIYSEGFGSYKFGYASAEAWFLFFIILIVTLVNFWGQKKWVHY
jgi:multiple sugar transport system permease protein